MKRCTTVRSMTLVRTGVMEIGRKSECSLGAETLDMGLMLAHFHCFGTAEVDKDRLKSRATGSQKAGAPSRRNQAGSPSSPVAVGLSLSRILNT